MGVFCGAKDGVGSSYNELAYSIGKKLANLSIGLVYGGAKSGLWGLLLTLL